MDEAAKIACRSIIKRGSLQEVCDLKSDFYKNDPQVTRTTLQTDFNY